MTKEEREALQAKVEAKKTENANIAAEQAEEEALLAEAKELGIEVPEVKKQTKVVEKTTEKKEVKKEVEKKDEKTSITKEDIKAVVTDVVAAIKDSSQEKTKEEEVVLYG